MEERTRYLIDTNIILEYLFEQERAEECFLFLEQLAEGSKDAYITSLALHTIEILAVRDRLFDELIKFLDILLSFRGLSIHHSTLNEEKAAIAASRRFGLDFEDALQYAVAKEHGLMFVSFDRDFDKTDLKRIEPKNIAL